MPAYPQAPAERAEGDEKKVALDSRTHLSQAEAEATKRKQTRRERWPAMVAVKR